ncbi:MAG TPA: SdrD B-like domain-containing protein [Chitinophagales bacterium]|nr:SdrD B-like domain-containing protein [Chitinophagales bacterium]
MIKTLAAGQAATVNAGDDVTFTITVYNQGTLNATNIAITDYIPSGMVLADADWTDNGNGTASYLVSALNAGSSTTVDITLQVSAGFQGSSLNNFAEISSAEDGNGNPVTDVDSTPDTNPDNDTVGGDDVVDNSNGDEDDHDGSTIGVNQTFDLALIKTLAAGQAATVNAGDVVNYTLTVINQGSLDAFNVMVLDYLPEGMDLADAAWTDNGNGTASYNTALTIPVGQSVTVNLALQVMDSFEGNSLTNFAEISSAQNGLNYPDVDSTPDTNPDNDTVGGNDIVNNSNGDEDDHDFEGIEVIQTFDLALIKTLASGQAGTVMPGDNVTFTITIFNQGTITATNVQINDYLLGSMTLNDSDWTMVNGTTAQLVVPISEIVPGDSYSVDITLTVNSNYQFNVATNRAEIGSANNDLGYTDIDSSPDNIWDNDVFGGDDITNNSNGDEDDADPAAVNVIQTFDLALRKQLATGQATVVNAGDVVNYTLTVINQGSLDAFNVMVLDYLPEGMDLADAAWTDNGNGTASYNTALTIPVGQSVTVNLALQVMDSFEGNSLTNFAEISSAQNGLNYPDVDSTPDTNPDNDTVGGNDIVNNSNGDEDDHDFEGIEVIQTFDLALIKKLAAGQSSVVSAGDNVTFTITLYNQGTLTATQIFITDYMPAGMSLADADWTNNGDGTASYQLSGSIAPGASATVDITLQVAADFEGTTLVNYAEISGAKDEDGNSVTDVDSTPDMNPNNDVVGGDDVTNNSNGDEDDHDPASVGVNQVFDLALIKQVSAGQSASFVPGNMVNYTITVYNQGTLTAQNITITDYIPSGMSLADADWTNNGNGTASYIMDGSVLPGSNASVQITLQITPGFAGGSLNNRAEISAAEDGEGNPATDVDSTPDTNPGNDVVGGDDVTDNSNGDEDDHDGATINVCHLASVAVTTLCDDNGTGASSDDLFTFTLMPTGLGTGSTYNVSGDVTANGLSYASAQQFGPFPISGGDLDLTITDNATGGCSTNTVVEVPAACSVCSINGVSVQINCNDNDTGTDTDDLFTFTLNPIGVGLSGTYSIVGDVTAAGIPYGSASQAFGPFPISGGNLNIVIIDDAEGTCDLDVIIEAPQPCSNCTLVEANVETNCDDNNTGTAADDVFYFTLNPTGVGIAGTYNVSGDVTATGIAYGAPHEFGPFPISGGDLDITITDGAVGGCTLNAMVDAPAPCSTCTLSAANVLTDCDDNNTGSAADDVFYFTLNPTGAGIGSTYNVSGDVTATGIAYGAPHEFGPFPISGGDLDITIADASANGCTLSVNIDAPAPCSTCSLSAANASVTCNDNDTGITSDDVFYFTISPTGSGISSTYNVSGDVTANGIPYGNVQQFGPFPISGGDLDITITDAAVGGCALNVNIDAPAPCSNPIYDLALVKTLAPGQASSVATGATVNFAITVYNQGDVPVQNVQVIDYIPTGLTLNSVAWTNNGNGTASITLPGTLNPGQSATVLISFITSVTTPTSAVNRAEISGAQDTQGNPVSDIDSNWDTNPNNDIVGGNNFINNENGDEDDHDIETINITVPPANLGNFVWQDLNQDGIQNSGEPGIHNALVTLYDASGWVVATQFTNVNGSYLFTDLIPGTYYVVFSTPNDANGNPMIPTLHNAGVNDELDSDANPVNGQSQLVILSPGELNLSIDAGFYIQAPPVLLGSIGNFVWNDLNQNGQQDTGETGIAGVTVTLYNATNNTIVATTTTNTNGFYLFENLPAGNYYVVFGTPLGYTPSPANTGNDATDSDAGPGGQTGIINLSAGETDLTIDAGYYVPSAPLGTIGNYVWFDQDIDGQQDSNEPGISGVTVLLYNAATNTIVGTDITDVNGLYLFENLPAGNYYVVFGTPSGYSPAPTNIGNDASDSDAGLGGQTGVINLAPGENNLTIDAGFILPGTISGTLWVDLNQNTVINPVEPLLSAVAVVLLDSNGNVVATTTTNTNGFYQFTNLAPGTYTIQVQVVVLGPSGNVTLYTPNNIVVVLGAGQNSPNNNFGYIPPAVLNDVVWLDLNGNCVLDSNEQGLAGIQLQVFNSAGQLVTTVVTGVNGSFIVSNLLPGIYTINVVPTTLPDGTQIGGGSITYDMATGQVLIAQNFCVEVEEEIVPCTHPDQHLCTEPMTPIVICPDFCLPEGWSFASVQTTYNCSLVLYDDCIQYTPLPLFIGTDVITIVGCYNGVCETLVVYVTVGDCTPIPCTPETINICTAPMTPVVVCPEFCLDGDYTITQVNTLFNCGIQVLANGCIQYTALPGFIGSEVISVTACNDAQECETVNINVTVTASGNCNTNSPPVAVNDVASVIGGNTVTIPVLVNDFDPDGDAISITSNTPPTSGTVVLSGNQFIYTPASGFTGTATFTYQICDTHGACDVATVTITVTQPCVETTYICTQPLTPLTICPAFCNIPNGTITITNATTTYNCSLYMLTGGCFQYTALPLFAGQEIITVTGCNQFGVCQTVQITVNVTANCDDGGMAPQGDSPIGAPDNTAQKVLYGTENGTQLINLAITNIAPVPATEFVDVQFNMVAADVTIDITDLNGRVMNTETFTAQQGMNHHRVMVQNYPAGIYMVSLKSGDAMVNGKFVKY